MVGILKDIWCLDLSKETTEEMSWNLVETWNNEEAVCRFGSQDRHL